jgi:hypothetical protein
MGRKSRKSGKNPDFNKSIRTLQICNNIVNYESLRYSAANSESKRSEWERQSLSFCYDEENNFCNFMFVPSGLQPWLYSGIGSNDE